MIRAIIADRKTMTRRLATSPLRRAQPGDQLWVRETWQVPALCDVQYRATATERIGHWHPEQGPWRPSIHMPRWACRLRLSVTAVRTERLQEITEDDAMAEGVDPFIAGREDWSAPIRTYRMGFLRLWGSLHGPNSWLINPEVIVISFVRMR